MPQTLPPLLRRAPWIGVAAGVAVAAADFLTLSALDVTMRAADQDVFWPVALFFALSYAALGGLVGWMVRARRLLAQRQETIAAQLAELEASQRELLQAEKLAAVGRMAAGVAHEVRNPLGVIRSSAALVAEDMEEGTDDHEALQFVVEEVDRLDLFVTELLDFSRPARADLQPVSLERVVADARRLASGALAERQVEFADPQPPAPEVLADADLLSRALAGLIINAAQSVEPGGHVAARVQAEGERVQLDICDDGPGVDMAQAEQIFEPFFTTRADGTGLGLAMAEKLIEAQRGHLRLVERGGLGPEGAGACFRVTFEADPAQERFT